jgi:hypothetical protein
MEFPTHLPDPLLTMATVAAYVTQMLTRERVIAKKLGCDIRQADKPTRVLNLAMLVMLAVVVKTLVDKGVVTDADLLATMDTARDDAYNDQPTEPPPPEPDP